ncbi:hypothetical protein BJV78DRAFT_1227361, partial [Lactifluus subvellereus]
MSPSQFLPPLWRAVAPPSRRRVHAAVCYFPSAVLLFAVLVLIFSSLSSPRLTHQRLESSLSRCVLHLFTSSLRHPSLLVIVFLLAPIPNL